MTKLTLNSPTSGYLSTEQTNANNAAVVAALENTVSRDGTAPNFMSAQLDMNSNKIINVAAPTLSSDAVRLVDLLNAGIIPEGGVPIDLDWDSIENKPASFPPSAHTHDDATTTTDGFMSAADKARLDALGSAAVLSVAGRIGAVVLAAADVSGVVATSTKGVANGVASLDGSGLVPTAQLPAAHFASTFVVASQAAMLALSTAVKGDFAQRTDTSNTYILNALPPATLANWILFAASGAVSSVNGLTGAIINTPKSMGELPNLVQDYGAVADGTTNCLTAWNNAMADINSGVIPGIQLPAKPFVLNGVTTTITKTPFSIQGAGSGASRIIATGGTGPVISYNGDNDGCISLHGFTISTTQDTTADRTACSIKWSSLHNAQLHCSTIWDNVDIRAETLVTQGFNKGVYLENAIGFFCTNSQWVSHISNTAAWAFSSVATSGKYSLAAQFDNCWFQNWDVCSTGTGDQQGFIWNKCLFEFSRKGIDFTSAAGSPFFQISGCQFETTEEAIALDGFAFPMLYDNVIFKDAAAGRKAIIKLNNCSFGKIHDNTYAVLGTAGVTTDVLTMANCVAMSIHDEIIDGWNGDAIIFSGTSAANDVRNIKYLNPVGSSYTCYSDTSGALSNTRRQGGYSLPSRDPGIAIDAGVSGTVTTTPQVFATVPMPVYAGDRLQLQAQVFVQGPSNNPALLNARIRESAHKPGTANPYNIIRAGATKNFVFDQRRIDLSFAGSGSVLYTMSHDVDVIATATDATFVLELYVDIGTATCNYGELSVKRH